MACFRDFTEPLWEIFGGNLLMFVTSAFYIAWWTVSFWPNRKVETAWPSILIGTAVLAGVAAIAIMSIGIGSLSLAGKGFPVLFILLGAVASYIILLVISKTVFRRPVTSELLLIIVWAAVELSAIAVLQGTGRFGMGWTFALLALVALAVGVGVVCYILYYNLDERARFWTGLIPLITDAGVVTVFLLVLALS
jgi:hypothetical protein